MPPQQYLLLALADQPLAPPKSTAYVRCLNVNGRWAVHGTAQAPLLVWALSDATAAKAAAQRASEARGQRVAPLTRGHSGWQEGRNVQAFTAAHEAALLGHAAHSDAKARRLQTEAEKLEAYCVVILQAAAAKSHASYAEVSRAAASALRVKFGGGSISSCAAWLAGRHGRMALESVLAGEVELTGPLSLQQSAEAVEFARETESLRDADAGSGA